MPLWFKRIPCQEPSEKFSSNRCHPFSAIAARDSLFVGSSLRTTPRYVDSCAVGKEISDFFGAFPCPALSFSTQATLSKLPQDAFASRYLLPDTILGAVGIRFLLRNTVTFL